MDSPRITGRTAVPGEASGKICIIITSADVHLVEDGDILVTPMTDPDMVPAMLRASAVVTDRGGRLCHAAIVCREILKPCVVGCVSATKALADIAEARVSALTQVGAIYTIS